MKGESYFIYQHRRVKLRAQTSLPDGVEGVGVRDGAQQHVVVELNAVAAEASGSVGGAPWVFGRGCGFACGREG